MRKFPVINWCTLKTLWQDDCCICTGWKTMNGLPSNHKVFLTYLKDNTASWYVKVWWPGSWVITGKLFPWHRMPMSKMNLTRNKITIKLHTIISLNKDVCRKIGNRCNHKNKVKHSACVRFLSKIKNKIIASDKILTLANNFSICWIVSKWFVFSTEG